ncbi:MAG: sugar transferase [Parvibaculum sp.]|uniref:sugar transferase n=1 Tax=Parvibaculum sp. TaxID=2024848 RepID=UPI003C791737
MATTPSEKIYDVVKRPLDMLLSGAALVVLAVPIMALAVVVRLSIGSPVFFRQPRVGRGGRIFTLIKFRSMRDARDATGQLLSDAERLTPLGRFMRRTSLDELPGLWNVLTGDMSLVGPRPLLVDYLPYYTPEQARRHAVRPGITGLAQVNGRNAVDWNTRFRFDLDYVERRSFSLDLEILARTLSKVLQGHGIESETDLPMPRFDNEVRAGRASGTVPPAPK